MLFKGTQQKTRDLAHENSVRGVKIRCTTTENHRVERLRVGRCLAIPVSYVGTRLARMQTHPFTAFRATLREERAGFKPLGSMRAS